MAEWAIAAGTKLERTIPKIVFGLYNVMSEDDTIFGKPAALARPR